jgi:cysteinyl-tRNA synthetase
MIFLIKQLEDRGVTYETPEAVYFDTSAFPGYGALSGQKLEDKKQAVREDVHADPDKRHPQDFALWFKRVGRFANHTMHWESPWGDGFPGWHIECSAMSMHYLGQELDIHTGGIDHIPVHHENEIAQSEAATGKQFVRYWVHHNFLQVDGQKMSKSLGNVYTYKDLEERGIHPLALRLLFLQTHYRQEMNFTWESARAAQEAFTRLSNIVLDLKEQTAVTEPEDESRLDTMRTRFRAALSEDLQTPQAVAILWEVARSSLSPQNKLFLLMEFDSALGLGFSTLRRVAIPEEIQQLARQRDMARAAKDWSSSDSIRGEIESRGYAVEDTSEGTRIVPK